MSDFRWPRGLRAIAKMSARRPVALLREEDGAATVEAVIWIPTFILMIALAADVAMVFHSHSRVLRVAQDVNRAMSVGRITSTDDAEATIVAMLSPYQGVAASTSVHDGIITTDVTVPAASAMPLGFAKVLLGSIIRVRSEQFAEQ